MTAAPTFVVKFVVNKRLFDEAFFPNVSERSFVDISDHEQDQEARNPLLTASNCPIDDILRPVLR